MSRRIVARAVLALVVAAIIALLVAGISFAQSDDQTYLPLIQQGEQSVIAAGHGDDYEGERQPRRPKPTIVLVHGAWADGTGWQEVIKRLDNKGYVVFAVQNPLTSLVDDVATTKRLLDAQTGPTVVVAHSYGGAVITGAAAGNPNVKALVYIAAFAPAVGEPLGLLLQQYPTELGQILDFDAAGFAYLDRTRFRTVFAGDVNRTTAAVMAAAQTPAFGGIFSEHLDVAAWETIPAWYMVAKEDKALSPDMERFLANRMGATTVEISASHVPFVSQPDKVVDFIEQAVRATMN